ncbi:MAG: serine/threonine-protein kinase [Pseudomonadota bacterium]
MSSLKDLSFQSAATFTFVEEIGRGGMGIVYLAEKHCEGVSDLVVIKTIRSMNEKQLDMLKSEANVAAALRHENIVRTYGLEAIPFDSLPVEFQNELYSYRESNGAGGSRGKELMSSLRMGQFRTMMDFTEHPLLIDESDDGGKRLYLIVMEYIEGWDLREIHSKHIRAGSLLPITLNAFIISRLCRALEYAHQYIVHRDLSPENVLISHQGVTKLMDFGIAVAADQEAFGLSGKIQYMAPEQVRNEHVDNRSDVFALGLVAYQMLTGISLFLTPNGLDFRAQADYYEQQLVNLIIPPHEICLDVPEAYSQIIMKMLAPDSEDRYQKIDEVGSDIEKKFIYAEGFGPTNNSLAAYLKMFESDFQIYTKEDLQQLAFMADDDNTYQLKRKIRKSLYTDEGFRLLQSRRSIL